MFGLLLHFLTSYEKNSNSFHWFLILTEIPHLAKLQWKKQHLNIKIRNNLKYDTFWQLSGSHDRSICHKLYFPEFPLPGSFENLCECKSQFFLYLLDYLKVTKKFTTALNWTDLAISKDKCPYIDCVKDEKKCSAIQSTPNNSFNICCRFTVCNLCLKFLINRNSKSSLSLHFYNEF